jgi:phosphoserine phosphatase
MLKAFDLEGTLSLITKAYYKYPSVWPALAERLGPDCWKEENDLTDKWNAQLKDPKLQPRMTYVEYMDRTIRLHQKYSLTEQLFAEVLNGIPWIDGIEETFTELSRHGHIIAIITGGFVNQAERVPGRQHVNYIRGACTYHFDSSGRLARWDLKEYDVQGKVAVINELCAKHGLDPKKDTMHVGDGKNDVYIAKAVGRSIALNAMPELREVATHVIDATDLRAILPYLIS